MIEAVRNRIKTLGVRKTALLILQKIFQAVYYASETRLKKCQCCNKLSIFLCLGTPDEFVRCIRCGANRRYEMIASSLKCLNKPLSDLRIVEFDPSSPLRSFLSAGKEYIRTYYYEGGPLGSVREDGARCEDLTKLTFSENSIDLMISSDVLEHIPEVEKVFAETERVLRPGGLHVFTVPRSDETKKRAYFEDGKLIFAKKPQYHVDPANPEGILAFWDFDMNLDQFNRRELSISIFEGPDLNTGRIVFKAEKNEESAIPVIHNGQS